MHTIHVVLIKRPPTVTLLNGGWSEMWGLCFYDNHQSILWLNILENIAKPHLRNGGSVWLGGWLCECVKLIIISHSVIAHYFCPHHPRIGGHLSQQKKALAAAAAAATGARWEECKSEITIKSKCENCGLVQEVVLAVASGTAAAAISLDLSCV